MELITGTPVVSRAARLMAPVLTRTKQVPAAELASSHCDPGRFGADGNGRADR
jgi:hypothetical protein